MKKLTIIFLLTMFIGLLAQAQTPPPFKIHSNGRVSFQSSSTSGGVQIDTEGRISFEPNISSGSTPLTQTKVLSNTVRTWTVRFSGEPMQLPEFRFYVTGGGDAYGNNHYTINPGGHEPSKGHYPIEDATSLISGLNGYYYDIDDFDGFKPDFVNNPNIAPEAVEGMLKDLKIDKALGLSIDDLEEVLPEAVRHDPEGMVYINYSAVIPVLVEAFKEQQHTIESLQDEIADLKANAKGYYGVDSQGSSENTLYQNTPNPTSSSTTIECFLAPNASRATIAVYDLNGLQIKEYPVHHHGNNTITIAAGEFKPGMYMYSLLVDGKLVDTKRMVITSK